MKHWLSILLLALPISALACPDCQDEICVFTACICVPNVGRCPPPPPPLPERFAFCNITENMPGQQARCTNCSSNLSGDLGKADCLARHLGHYVKSGECTAVDCSTIASVSPPILFRSGTTTTGIEIAKTKSGIPNLLKATKMEITKLTSEGKTVKAFANVVTIDGRELACSYEMSYKSSKNGLKFTPRSESCALSK